MSDPISTKEKRKIGQLVREEMERNEDAWEQESASDLICAPKQLIDATGLSDKTIYKALKGEFSDRTLRKIETAFGRKFQLKSGGDATLVADECYGGYARSQVEYAEGEYFVVRPIFKETAKNSLYMYCLRIQWGTKANGLYFEEYDRTDPKFENSGYAYYAGDRPYLTFFSDHKGSLRMLTVTKPEEDDSMKSMFGLLSTMRIPRRGVFVPVATPIVLRLQADEQLAKHFESGSLIRSSDEVYNHASDLLDRCETDGFIALYKWPPVSPDLVRSKHTEPSKQKAGSSAVSER